MDHLLPFGESKTRRVPLFTTAYYDSQDFHAFPERQGWSKAEITAPTEHGRSAEELNGFLQRWLYFGVLYEFFGKNMRHSDFIDGKFLSTRLLRQYVADFVAKKIRDDDDCVRDHSLRVTQVLETVEFQIRQIAFNASPLVDPRSMLAIVILSDFLRRVSGLAGKHFSASYFHTREVRSTMWKAGWCPSTIKNLNSKLDPASFFLCSRFNPPEGSGNKLHSSCNGRRCMVTQLDESVYRTTHVCATEDCKELVANGRELFESLKAGQIPLAVYASSNDFDDATLKLLRYRPGLKYVAISHVWSDKMGNPRANALPQCQLQRVQRLVDALYESEERPMPFWIDTISCPTSPDEATDLAITLMRETYSNADKVLVLDSFIQRADSKGATPREVALRVLCSGWARRLWTLQEGVLAKCLFLQFKDGIVEFDDMFNQLRSSASWYEYSLISNALEELRGAWSRPDLLSSGLFVDFSSAVLRYRATSVATDEALCLSTLARLEMDKILAVAPQQRMRMFWSLLPIPAKIIFRTGETLSDPGFRWAPTSLLSSQKMRTIEEAQNEMSTFFGHNDEPFPILLEDYEPTSYDVFETSTPLGTLSPAGLVIQWTGMFLGPWTASLGLGFFVKDQASRYYFVGCHLGQSKITRAPPASGEGELALLLEKNPGDIVSDTSQYIDSTTAVILSVNRREGDIMHVSIESVGFIQPQLMLRNSLEAAGGIDFVVDLVNSCEAALDSVIVAQETGGGSEQDEASSSSTVAKETKATNMVQAVMISDTTTLEVSKENGRISIVRDGEHFFYDGYLTSESQIWCID